MSKASKTPPDRSAEGGIPVIDFSEAVREEIDAINYRRIAISQGEVAASRPLHPDAKPIQSHLRIPRSEIRPEKLKNSIKTDSLQFLDEANLTGLALSGGGVRSASFCLGVLQGIDSLSNHDEPHVLDGLDYISTVSGGGYIGTSLVAAMMQPDYGFPFESRFDEEETPETQHLRDYSNFLAPDGIKDYLTSAALVVRGLLINAVITTPLVLALVIVTVVCTPTETSLTAPNLLGMPINENWLPYNLGTGNFVLTTYFIAFIAVILVASSVYTSLTYRRGSLVSRNRLSHVIAVFILLLGIVALFELQPYMLRQLFRSHEGIDGGGLGTLIPRIGKIAAPFVAVLLTASQRLANIAKGTAGEATAGAWVKKQVSRSILYVAGIIVPLLLWIEYLYLSFWAIRVGGSANNPFTVAGTKINPFAPAWIGAFADWVHSLPLLHYADSIGLVQTAYAFSAIVLAAIAGLIGPNANSLHRMYRDRLSKAFLIIRPNAIMTPAQVDTFKFSELKPRVETDWQKGSAYSPFLLVNTAINLEGSPDLNKRGRNADTFTFSPLHVGSKATGYVATKAMEDAVKDLGLATAMATSGAAASANMGASTIKPLTFSLSLLNVRLGYWLANPAKLGALRGWWAKRVNIGFIYFTLETLGWLDEKTLNVYLTDGGHVENLGVYELLKRRCKVILAVDAEGDQGMTFPSLVNLQVMARIDLGIRIELPWEEIQSSALDVTATALHGAKGSPGGQGPHAAIGRILYDDEHTGVLIYIKSSLSGDENDYVLDYKRRNGTFPHETTVDQFFTEEQFEAYRALGFHAARGLLSGEDRFGTLRPKPPNWNAQVDSALALLNVPSAMAQAVVAHV